MTLKRSGIAITLSLFAGASGTALAQTPPDEDEAGMPAPPFEETVDTTPVELMPPVPPEPPPPPPPTAGYDKGFFIKSDTDKGVFELKIKARVQTLATFDSTDSADQRTNLAQFQIRRARLTFEGVAYTPKLKYKFQSDFGRGFLTLKDAFIDGEVGDKVWIRAGQWKRPFSRQQINTSGQLELVDRAITDDEFALGGRDIGVAIHNGYESSPDSEWAVGVFNGTGEKATFSGTADPTTGAVSGGGFSNVPKQFLPVLVGRFGVNRNGLKGYSEADLEGGALRWGAAASVWIEADFDDNGTTRRQAEADFVVKADGLSASGAFYFARVNGPMDALDVNTIGAHVQVGKMLGEKTRRMQPMLRYAMVMDLENPDVPDSADLSHEITAGFGWYPYGHDCKLQLDLGSRIPDGGGPTDRLIGRLQLSAGF